MTARIIRQRPGRESWQHFVWRVLLVALALVVVWLLLARATASQPPGPFADASAECRAAAKLTRDDRTAAIGGAKR
jgi:hypothetical protein